MAKCKYCHETISRTNDKDVCPFCGGKKPLEGTDTSTQDITKVIDQFDGELQIKHRKRIVCCVLAILLGILGIDEFYLGKIKKGLIFLAISLVFIGGLGTLLFFVTELKAFAFLIPYFIFEFVNIFKGIRYITSSVITDCNGEFLE